MYEIAFVTKFCPGAGDLANLHYEKCATTLV